MGVGPVFINELNPPWQKSWGEKIAVEFSLGLTQVCEGARWDKGADMPHNETTTPLTYLCATSQPTYKKALCRQHEHHSACFVALMGLWLVAHTFACTHHNPGVLPLGSFVLKI